MRIIKIFGILFLVYVAIVAIFESLLDQAGSSTVCSCGRSLVRLKDAPNSARDFLQVYSLSV